MQQRPQSSCHHISGCNTRCFPSVGRPSSFPWSSDVPFQNPAGPTFRRQGCNIRSKLQYCLDAILAQDVTNSSNSRMVSSRPVANTKRSSANLRLLIIKYLEDPITIVISITLNVIWACIVNRWKQNSSARDLCLHDQLFQVFQCILYFNHSPAKQQQLFFLPPIGRWWGRGHLKKRAIDPGG